MLSIVVPVYNEGANIGRLLARLEAAVHVPYEILVVYDFDEDDTLPALRIAAKPELRLQLVKNRKRGALEAIKTGLAAAGGDAVLVAMADLSDDLGIVDRMYELVQSGSAVVCGSRYMPGGRQIGGPFLKGQLSKLAGRSLHTLTGIPTHDVTNSFKMYRRDWLDRVSVESDGGFEIGMELTIKAYLAGLRVTELPATWEDRSAGESRFRLLRWLPKYLRWYLHLLTRRPRGKAGVP